MKKNILIACLAYTATALSLTPQEQHTQQIKKRELSFIEAGGTLSIWRAPQNIILDTGKNKDRIKGGTQKFVPGLYWSISQELYASSFYHTTFNIGLRLDYSQRKKAIKSNFFEADATQSDFFIEHSVKTCHATPFVALGAFSNKRFSLKTQFGPVFGLKTIEPITLWERATNAYTGQKLTPRNQNIFGYWSVLLHTHNRKRAFFTLGYSLLFGSVTFRKKITQETPDTNASEQFHDQLLLSDKDSIYLPEKPKLSYRAHTLSLGLTLLF